MKKISVMVATAGVMAAFLLPLAAQARALDILNPSFQFQAKKKTAKNKTSGNKTTFSSGSQETTKERTARLQRECKGAVNAGACAGFTR